MKRQNNKYEICLAKPSDAAQLLDIYESGDFRGDVSVLYTRRPDPFISLMNEGEKTVIPVVKDLENDVIVGMGACIIRKAYINGKIKNIGYLSGLKGLPEYRKKVPSIIQTYSYLHEETKDEVDLYYTTILKENTAVQKMLEKKRKFMPEYRRQGEYTVYSFRTGKKTKTKAIIMHRSGTQEWSLENGNLKALEQLDIWHPEKYNFSPADSALYGLSDQDVYILKDSYGKVEAVCALWNQQSWKQYIITGYNGMFKWLKKLPLKITGYPDLPKEGDPANYASISLLSVRDNDPVIAEQLIRMVAEKAVGYDFLMIGLYENHPLKHVMEKIKCIKYQSILYTVNWADSNIEPDGRPINLEVGLL